nr:MAG TPA: hypothetical protein [Caudoviricetes sp.]
MAFSMSIQYMVGIPTASTPYPHGNLHTSLWG